MQLSDFEFILPPELIAQHPADSRDSSRLLVYDRLSDKLADDVFPSIVSRLREGDLLVVNDTRVMPARLFGLKPSGGRVELLLVRPTREDNCEWLAMTRSSKPLKSGTIIDFGHTLRAEILAEAEDSLRRIRLEWRGDLHALLELVGHLPLPPYIRREATETDRQRYQTVFANQVGSVAAPTAGLHFTPEIFAALTLRGVTIKSLTLHVGPGTFLPVRTENLIEHRMHKESFHISEDLAASVNAARREGRRVVAVGTTTTRALESACDDNGQLLPGSTDTELFITPGYRFRIVDALVTNFHLPRSTLLVLVSAFTERERLLEVYRHAVAERYRFFSYGDCMLIV